MADQALTDLDGYQQAAGAFFEEITGGEIPADVLVESLNMHTETLFATIDSLVAGDGQVFTCSGPPPSTCRCRRWPSRPASWPPRAELFTASDRRLLGRR